MYRYRSVINKKDIENNLMLTQFVTSLNLKVPRDTLQNVHILSYPLVPIKLVKPIHYLNVRLKEESVAEIHVS